MEEIFEEVKKHKLTPEEIKQKRKEYLQTYIQKNYNGDVELWRYDICQKKLQKYYTNEHWKKELNDKRKAYYQAHKQPKKERKPKVKTEKQILMDEKLKKLKESKINTTLDVKDI